MTDHPDLLQAQRALTAALATLHQAAGTPVPDGPPDAPVAQQHAARLARLQAAQAALTLAASLLQADDLAAVQAVAQAQAQLADQVKAWSRSGRGWYEERCVTRTKIRRERNEDGTLTPVAVPVSYGPYRYFRWRDEHGKRHTRYLGRVGHDDTPDDAEPDDPAEQCLERGDPTVRDWLAACGLDAAQEARISAAQAEAQEAHSTDAQVEQTALWADQTDDAHTTLDQAAPPLDEATRATLQRDLEDTVQDLTRTRTDLDRTVDWPAQRSQVSREAALNMLETLELAIEQRQRVVLQRALLAELHRAHGEGPPPAAATLRDRLQAVVPRVIHESTTEELFYELQQQHWSIEEVRSLRAWRLQGLTDLVQQVRAAIRQTLAEQQQVAQQIADLGLDPLPWLAAPLALFADIQIGRVPEPPRPDLEATDAVA